MRSSESSDYSLRDSKTKFFRIQFSHLHFSKEDSVEIWCDQLKSQVFKAKHFANEYPRFVSADVAAVAHPDDLATNQITASRVGDGKRIASLAVAGCEVTP